MSPRDEQLLELLRGRDGWTAGEDLIALIGHRFSATILRLRKEGVKIESRTAGTNPRTGNRRCDEYRLLRVPEWTCSQCGSEVVASEMTLAPNLAHANCLTCRGKVIAKKGALTV
jgi:hypothetical protein